MASTDPIVMMPKPPIWMSIKMTSSPKSEKREMSVDARPVTVAAEVEVNSASSRPMWPGSVGRDREPEQSGAEHDEGGERAHHELCGVPDLSEQSAAWHRTSIEGGILWGCSSEKISSRG